MQTTNSTEFRNHTAHYLSEAESGDVIIIVRHGKPVAKLSPIAPEDMKASWQEPPLKLKIKGLSLTNELLKDREKDK